MIKLCVFGSRGFSNYQLMCQEIARYLSVAINTNQNVTIVSGMAKGADSLAIQYADAVGLDVDKFPAKWAEHGKSAGIIRNKEMAKHATHFIAFWDGESRGTGHMISEVTAIGKPLTIIRY